MKLYGIDGDSRYLRNASEQTTQCCIVEGSNLSSTITILWFKYLMLLTFNSIYVKSVNICQNLILLHFCRIGQSPFWQHCSKARTSVASFARLLCCTHHRKMLFTPIEVERYLFYNRKLFELKLVHDLEFLVEACLKDQRVQLFLSNIYFCY
jgi:hypothetical protein